MRNIMKQLTISKHFKNEEERKQVLLNILSNNSALDIGSENLCNHKDLLEQLKKTPEQVYDEICNTEIDYYEGSNLTQLFNFQKSFDVILKIISIGAFQSTYIFDNLFDEVRYRCPTKKYYVAIPELKTTVTKEEQEIIEQEFFEEFVTFIKSSKENIDLFKKFVSFFDGATINDSSHKQDIIYEIEHTKEENPNYTDDTSSPCLMITLKELHFMLNSINEALELVTKDITEVSNKDFIRIFNNLIIVLGMDDVSFNGA